MTALRLAHLSDPHLPAAPPAGREMLGKRFLSGINWRMKRHRHHRQDVVDKLTEDIIAQKPDVIAVTGDLVNFGLGREYDQARGWLDRLGQPDRVVVIPGNHDAMAPGWQAHFDRYWSGYAHRVPTMREFGPVSLICLSTAVVTPPFFASGAISAGDLSQAQDLIAAAARCGQIPVVLMHHPPTDISVWRKALRNHANIAKTLAGSGAALVLHGHTHRADLSTIKAGDARVPVIGVPSFSMAPGVHHPPGAWRMLSFEQSGTGPMVTLTERAINEGGEISARTPMRFTLPHQGGCPDPSNR